MLFLRCWQREVAEHIHNECYRRSEPCDLEIDQDTRIIPTQGVDIKPIDIAILPAQKGELMLRSLSAGSACTFLPVLFQRLLSFTLTLFHEVRYAGCVQARRYPL
jgi:hypothetical protein